MSEPIGPGTWVECMRSADRLGGVTAGAVYRVAAVIPEDVGCSGSCRAFGIVLSDGPTSVRRAWCGCRFRPLYRPKGKQLIRDLLQPVREDA